MATCFLYKIDLSTVEVKKRRKNL